MLPVSAFMIRSYSSRLLAPAGVLAMLLLAMSWWATPARAAQLLDGVAAVVNDSVILKSELDAEMQRITAALRAQNRQAPPEDVLRKQVLEHLIMIRIQLLEAYRRGLKVSDEQVDQALQNIAARN